MSVLFYIQKSPLLSPDVLLLFCRVATVLGLMDVCMTNVVSEFIEFVVNQKLCQKQWQEATDQCAELTTRCDQVQHENEALQTKLKHARSVHWLSVMSRACLDRLTK